MSADRSVLALIAANLVALALARDAGLRLVDMVAIYWVQSIIIGVTHTARVAMLRHYTLGRMVDLEAGPYNKFLFAGGFFFHYIIITLFIGFTLDVAVGFYRPESAEALRGWWLCTIVFALNHAYSLWYNIRRDRLGEPRMHVLMLMPYARVLPMQAVFAALTVAKLGTGLAAWIVFGLAKTAVDVAMHAAEHRVLQSRTAAQS